MTLPEPRPGLVIGYRYLWLDQKRRGEVEGRKDRPCVIVLAREETETGIRVLVAPVTHRPPSDGDAVVEIPVVTKRRLGLDCERSWVVVSEVNQFIWPGPDLRPVPGKGPRRFDYGMLPPRLFATIVDRLVALARERRLRPVSRTT